VHRQQIIQSSRLAVLYFNILHHEHAVFVDRQSGLIDAEAP